MGEPSASWGRTNKVGGKTNQHPAKRSRRCLDGYALLDAAGVALPEEAIHLSVAGAHPSFNDTDVTHLKEFVNLRNVDASANNLQLHMFAALKNVESLILASNFISRIDLLPKENGLFHSLQTLDLSFNNLCADAVNNLSQLPSLRELDISDNRLRFECAHIDWSAFRQLRILRCRRNAIGAVEEASSASIKNIGLAPRLEELDLEENQISVLPPLDKLLFPRLQYVNLSHNNLAKQEQLDPLLNIVALYYVDVRANPLATGQRADPYVFAHLCRLFVQSKGVSILLFNPEPSIAQDCGHLLAPASHRSPLLPASPPASSHETAEATLPAPVKVAPASTLPTYTEEDSDLTRVPTFLLEGIKGEKSEGHKSTKKHNTAPISRGLKNDLVQLRRMVRSPLTVHKKNVVK